MFSHALKFGRIRSRGFGVVGIQIWGMRFTANFQRRLAAKLYVEYE